MNEEGTTVTWLIHNLYGKVPMADFMARVMALPKYAGRDPKKVAHTITQYASQLRQSKRLNANYQVRWTAEQDEVLLDMAGKATVTEIAAVLGRSEYAVYQRAASKGLSLRRRVSDAD